MINCISLSMHFQLVYLTEITGNGVELVYLPEMPGSGAELNPAHNSSLAACSLETITLLHGYCLQMRLSNVWIRKSVTAPINRHVRGVTEICPREWVNASAMISPEDKESIMAVLDPCLERF